VWKGWSRASGFDARAADEEGLVAAVRRHVAEAHCMPLSDDEALLLVFHAELAAQPTTRHERTWTQSCCDDASGKDRSELEPSPNERLVTPLTCSC
jgi:hypothetical protein